MFGYIESFHFTVGNPGFRMPAVMLAGCGGLWVHLDLWCVQLVYLFSISTWFFVHANGVNAPPTLFFELEIKQVSSAAHVQFSTCQLGLSRERPDMTQG
jgi:hypothetical protein